MHLIDGHAYRLGQVPVAAVDCPPLGCFVLRALSGDALWQVSPDGAIRPLDGGEQPAPPCAHVRDLAPYDPEADDPQQVASALAEYLAPEAASTTTSRREITAVGVTSRQVTSTTTLLFREPRPASPAPTVASAAPPAVEALQCPQCGAPVERAARGAAICSFCGSRLRLADEAFRADTAILAARAALDHHEAALKRLLGQKAALMVQWAEMERRAPRGLSPDTLKLGVTLLFIAVLFGVVWRSSALFMAPFALWVVGVVISLASASRRRARLEQQAAATLAPRLTALSHEIAAAETRAAQLRAEMDRLTR